MSSLTGRERTLVAVGTAKEMSMFLAVRAGAPRNGVFAGSSRATLARCWVTGGSAGTPPRAPGALGRTSFVGDGFSTVGVRRDVAGSALGAVAEAACAGAGAGLAVVTLLSRRSQRGSAVWWVCGGCS